MFAHYWLITVKPSFTNHVIQWYIQIIYQSSHHKSHQSITSNFHPVFFRGSASFGSISFNFSLQCIKDLNFSAAERRFASALALAILALASAVA